MEEIIIPKIIIDNFRCEGYLPPLDYHHPSRKEIIRYHRSIELPNQSFAGIIGMLHIMLPLSSPNYYRNFGPIQRFNINTSL
ncbi:hypothetical protein ACOSQ4_004926 [Xanthoceras sorbifolium]